MDSTYYLDVYIPQAATEASKVPVLLWWHGGGLLQGTRKGTRLPGILADCKAAMEFLSSPAFVAATGNTVDASKLVVSGSSAGGWLSLLTGTGIGYAACGLDLPPKVAGIAALYPITDLADRFWTTKQHPVVVLPKATFVNPSSKKLCFSSMDSPRAIFYHYMVQEAILEQLLLEGTDIPAAAFAIAPQLRSGNSKFSIPAVYQIHGDIDDKVPCRQAADVEAALQEINAADHIYEELPDQNHLFDRVPECQMDNMYAFITRVTK
ncbi:Alpha/Beta hydrolase protein [Mycena amicta]|nr:Alpha/Beta hydrolase protein [Mycena amicta]